MDTTATPSSRASRKLFTYDGLDRIEVNRRRLATSSRWRDSKASRSDSPSPTSNTPERLAGISVEEPTISVDFLVNNSPFAGKEGKFVTSRQLRERLYKELERNVALRVEDTESTDTWTVSGRGELHLTILMETMRREGYEFQVSRPRVITREGPNGERLEPYEELAIDVPEEFLGAVIEKLGPRRGEMLEMKNPGQGMMRLTVPNSGARTVRLSLGVSDRHSRHGHHAPSVSGVRTVGGSAGRAYAWNAGLDGGRRDRCIRACKSRGAGYPIRFARRSGLRGDDGRREFTAG